MFNFDYSFFGQIFVDGFSLSKQFGNYSLFHLWFNGITPQMVSCDVGTWCWRVSTNERRECASSGPTTGYGDEAVRGKCALSEGTRTTAWGMCSHMLSCIWNIAAVISYICSCLLQFCFTIYVIVNCITFIELCLPVYVRLILLI